MTQPGRRFAKGATREDIYLGIFGFISHLFFFMTLGALLPKYGSCITGTLAIICLAVRAGMVGASTTKESIKAIKDAFTNE